MMIRSLASTGALIVVLLLVAGTEVANAQVRFGGGAGYNSKFNLGIGARVESGPLFRQSENEMLQRLEANVAVDYFFPACEQFFPREIRDLIPDARESGVDIDLSCGWWELNGNLLLPFPGAFGTDQNLLPYAGVGLSRASASAEFTASAFGDRFSETANASGTALNLIGGVRFPFGGMSGFGEARYRAADDGQFIISVGVLFGGR